MKKRKSIFLVLIVILLCVSMLMSVVACNTQDDKIGDETVTKKDLLIANGHFEEVSSENFPKTPGSWSGTAGSTGGSNAVDYDSEALSAGVIDVSKSAYDKNKKTWDKLENPGQVGDDNNILMIYNKKDTSYKYTVSNIKIETGKYYEVSMFVKTVNITGSGAFIYINGDAYGKYEGINTGGQWKELKFYVEGSNISDKTMSIVVSNGYYGKNDGKLSKGYVFCDSFTMKAVEKNDYANAVVKTNEVNKYSMFVADSEFEYISGTKMPYTASKYNGIVSKGESGNAPTGSDYIEKGVVDTLANYGDLAIAGSNISAPTGSYGNNVFYIHNKKKTAYGYRNGNQIRFTNNQYTKLSVKVRTDILEENNIDGTGAIVKLVTGTDDFATKYEIKGIRTDSQWVEYSFYVKGHNIRNKDMYLEFWFGEGGKESLTLVEGTAYFDMITLNTATQQDYDSIVANPESNVKALAVDLTDSEENTIFTESFSDAQNIENWKITELKKEDNIVKKGEMLTVDKNNWDTKYGENPLSPAENINNLLMINNPTETVFKVNRPFSNDEQKIVSNNYYRVGAWIKTSDISKELGLEFSLYQLDPDKKEDEQKVSLSSFTKINTLNYKNTITAQNNDYIELVFYIEGHSMDSKEIFIEFGLGSGTALDPTNHVKGRAFVTNVTMTKVTPGEYSSASSNSSTKKYSFASVTGTTSNGNYDSIDIASTISQYENIKEVSDLFDSNGLPKQFGLPKNWTTSDKAVLTNLNTGVFNVNSSALIDMLGIDIADFYKGFPSTADVTLKSNANVLAISTKDAGANNNLTEPTSPNVCGCDCDTCIKEKYCNGKKCSDSDCDCAHKMFGGSVSPWGYTSNSMSLGKTKYFKVSVWVKTVDDAIASVTLETTQKNQELIFNDIETGGMWKEYSFYVETGLSDVNAKINLFLGNKGDKDIKYSGTVLFDKANYYEVDEDEYNRAVEKKDEAVVYSIKTGNYSTDSFDNYETSETSLYTPNEWSGSYTHADAPQKENNESSVQGIFNKNNGDWDLFGGDDASTKVPENVKNYLFENISDTIIIGDNILAINNKEATGYSFTNKFSNSMSVDTYYEVSAYVFTYGLTEADNAYITLSLNNKTYTFAKSEENKVKVNTSSYTAGTETIGVWTKYSFYVKTAPKTAISEVKLTLGLGIRENDTDKYVKGYAFYDSVTLAKINEEEFEKAVPVVKDDDGKITEEKYSKSTNFRIEFSEEDIEEEPPVDDETTPDRTLFWLGISSAVIGGIIVIVVIVVLVQKFMKKRKKQSNASKNIPGYNKNKTDGNSSTSSTRKNYKK